ncbi:MAG TPA: HAMP domain-containing sensor histidine kinase [Phycisphaerae bacterium]|nr:HAMP domain-containing sensor histidine kinase [Phycisphaerae bacterium]
MPPRAETSEPTGLPLAPDALPAPAAPPGAGCEAAAGPRRFRRTRLTLPLKAMLMLVTLVIAVVGLGGGIAIATAKSMMHDNKRVQIEEFAYGIAAVLPDGTGAIDPPVIESELRSLWQTKGVDFAMVTDTNMTPIGGYVRDAGAWSYYRTRLLSGDRRLSGQVGKVLDSDVGLPEGLVLAVPVFGSAPGGPSQLVGYLHVAMNSADEAAQVRYLEGYVLLASMGIVLLALPIAGLVARHITVPIQRLAGAARALAQSGSLVRVDLTRSDELGELAETFNQMATTLQAQQENIRNANIDLELKVRERTQELESVNRRLTAEMAEKEDFLRAVSHDLNAPLRNISGMADVLMRKYSASLNTDAVQRLERIQKNVDVECELLNELLELSRIKSRREKMEPVDLHDLAQSVAEAFGADFETRGITFRMLSHLPVMRCEKARIRQVFQNLIDNATKYMRADGPREISVSFRWQGEEAVLSVKDTGMGIAAEDMGSLFRVFRRAKNASMLKIPGKGVGLAYVKSIVETYRGRLWAESYAGEGTTFYIAFPQEHFDMAHEVAA